MILITRTGIICTHIGFLTTPNNLYTPIYWEKENKLMRVFRLGCCGVTQQTMSYDGEHYVARTFYTESGKEKANDKSIVNLPLLGRDIGIFPSSESEDIETAGLLQVFFYRKDLKNDQEILDYLHKMSLDVCCYFTHEEVAEDYKRTKKLIYKDKKAEK